MWSLLLVFNEWHYLCYIFEHLRILLPFFLTCYYIWRHLHWYFDFVSWLMAYFFCDFAFLFFFRFFFAVSCFSLTLFPFLPYNLVIFLLSFPVLSAETHFTWRTLCPCLPVLLENHKSSQQASGCLLLAWICLFSKFLKWQRSPTFGTLGTSFTQDSLSTDNGEGAMI